MASAGLRFEDPEQQTVSTLCLKTDGSVILDSHLIQGCDQPISKLDRAYTAKVQTKALHPCLLAEQPGAPGVGVGALGFRIVEGPVCVCTNP